MRPMPWRWRLAADGQREELALAGRWAVNELKAAHQHLAVPGHQHVLAAECRLQPPRRVLREREQSTQLVSLARVPVDFHAGQSPW